MKKFKDLSPSQKRELHLNELSYQRLCEINQEMESRAQIQREEDNYNRCCRRPVEMGDL